MLAKRTARRRVSVAVQGYIRAAIARHGRLLAAALLAGHFLAAGTGRASAGSARRVPVKILAINDFHGQIGTGKTGSSGPNSDVGGAPVLAAYLKRAESGLEDRTFIVSAGDLVGGSPANSALLQDEPTILFMNKLANGLCRDPLSSRCNVVATLGNHELDRGVDELKRLTHGGNHAEGPFLEKPYGGARYPYVAANVIDDATGRPLLPPYVIKKVGGVPIAFIGAALKETPAIVGAAAAAGLTFLDEAEAVNHYIPEIKAKGVRAIVVIIHDGGVQDGYAGPTDPLKPSVSGEIVRIVSRLDGEVDVVVSGHTHTFVNALVKNSAGRDVLVTQAYSAGAAYADISLQIDSKSKEIVEKSAIIVSTFASGGDGGARVVTPDAEVARLVAAADAFVAPKVSAVVGQAASAITRTENVAGESALGDLIADAQRASGGTHFAFTHSGGIRNDLQAGTITWGDLFSIQPFRRRLVTMTLTGQQIYELLAQQWANPSSPRMLQVSGLTYSWTSNGQGQAGTVREVRMGGKPIDRSATYTVATTNQLAAGGAGFGVLKTGLDRVVGAEIVDVLAAYIQRGTQPLKVALDERITRITQDSR